MTSEEPLSFLIVAGPTASGKSALALRLAEALDGTIVNADSMQIYRDLPILTARPGPAEEVRVPHRLYGVIDAAEACTAGRWRALALAEIRAARSAGRVPILTGGTGLYFHVLLHGLAEVPPIPVAAREAAQILHAELGAEEFRSRLALLDPEATARIVPGDTQRLTRAYEVALATGRALSDWQKDQAPPEPLRATAIVLLPPRDKLYEACDHRLSVMAENGVDGEIRALLARGLAPELPAMKAVGLRELALWVEGKASRADALAAAQQATRRYAKRQFTWLRHKLLEGDRLRKLTLNAQYSESLWPEILPFIRQSPLTPPI